MALASVLFASAYSPVLSALGQTANVRVTSWQLARSRPFVRMVSGYARGDDGRKVDVDEALVDPVFAVVDEVDDCVAAAGVFDDACAAAIAFVTTACAPESPRRSLAYSATTMFNREVLS